MAKQLSLNASTARQSVLACMRNAEKQSDLEINSGFSQLLLSILGGRDGHAATRTKTCVSHLVAIVTGYAHNLKGGISESLHQVDEELGEWLFLNWLDLKTAHDSRHALLILRAFAGVREEKVWEQGRHCVYIYLKCPIWPHRKWTPELLATSTFYIGKGLPGRSLSHFMRAVNGRDENGDRQIRKRLDQKDGLRALHNRKGEAKTTAIGTKAGIINELLASGSGPRIVTLYSDITDELSQFIEESLITARSPSSSSSSSGHGRSRESLGAHLFPNLCQTVHRSTSSSAAMWDKWAFYRRAVPHIITDVIRYLNSIDEVHPLQWQVVHRL